VIDADAPSVARTRPLVGITTACAPAGSHGLPVLAICRGMQRLNVAWGGTLIQDLPSQRPGPVEHRQRDAVDRTWHGVEVEAGSGLHRLLGEGRLRVNSFHHQAIDRLAAGLRCTARLTDGVAEGVESTDGRWIHGVQWHPERGPTEAPDGSDAGAALFRGFVEACEETRGGEGR
jgi:putative glutamine amidotransferase